MSFTPQQQNILDTLNTLNTLNQNISTSFNSLSLKNCWSPNPSSTDIELEQLEQENKKLKEEIKNIIEQEDEKQKILKIISPSYLNKDISATTVIVYGNISGNINAENVLCMEGNINSNKIQANKIFTKTISSAALEDEISEYRKAHPDCKYCKFRKEGEKGSDFQRLAYPTDYPQYLCSITEKIVNRNSRIRANFCKYYEPKEGV